MSVKNTLWSFHEASKGMACRHIDSAVMFNLPTVDAGI